MNHHCTTDLTTNTADHSYATCLQSNSAVCLCKQDQGGGIIKALPPPPTPEQLILISWSRCSIVSLQRCFVLMRFWQLKQRSVSAFPTITHRQATINRYISVKHTSNNMCEHMSTHQLITTATLHHSDHSDRYSTSGK